MTQNINSIANLLVNSGLSEAEAFDMAEVENAVAERAYIDYAREEAEDAEYMAYMARFDFSDVRVIDGDVCVLDIRETGYYGYPVYRVLDDFIYGRCI